MHWRVIDRASQLGFLVACIVLTVVAVTRHCAGTGGGVQAAAVVSRGETVVAQQGLQPRAAAMTVVVVVDPACVHCTLSMPFYAKLAERAERSKRAVGVVFAGKRSPEALVEYLRQHAIRAPVVTGTPPNLSVRGTPTLLVLNSSGKVLGGWLGRLNHDQEETVLKMIAQGSVS